MWKIAQRHGISLGTLIAANPHIGNPNVLNIGDQLNVPVEAGGYGAPPNYAPAQETGYSGMMWQYAVKPGDSLWKIAQQAGVPLHQLIQANPQLGDPNQIMPGQMIHIPGAQPSYGAPYSPAQHKEMYTAQKEMMTAPIKPVTPAPGVPVAPTMPSGFPPINVDADFHYTQIKEENKETIYMPKMQSTPPAVAKIYVKQEPPIIQAPPSPQPIGEQVICWDPNCPPPLGPIFEGPFIPATPSMYPPFTPSQVTGVVKGKKIRESSSMWGRESSWFKESSR